MNAKVLVYHDRAILVINEKVYEIEGTNGQDTADNAAQKLVVLCSEIVPEAVVETVDYRAPAAKRRCQIRRQLHLMGYGKGINELNEEALKSVLTSVNN